MLNVLIEGVIEDNAKRRIAREAFAMVANQTVVGALNKMRLSGDTRTAAFPMIENLPDGCPPFTVMFRHAKAEDVGSAGYLGEYNGATPDIIVLYADFNKDFRVSIKQYAQPFMHEFIHLLDHAGVRATRGNVPDLASTKSYESDYHNHGIELNAYFHDGVGKFEDFFQGVLRTKNMALITDFASKSLKDFESFRNTVLPHFSQSFLKSLKTKNIEKVTKRLKAYYDHVIVPFNAKLKERN